MAYLDYPGLAYFKSLLDESYLRTDYEGDTIIKGNVTFTEPVDASVKNDWLGQQIDKTYVKDLRPEDDGEVALIYGDNHEKVITIDTAVTQVRSDANEMYPILLCYDANAEVNQISKSVRYGHNVAINPAYGYVYANSYIVKHPTYNRTISSTTRVEWASDFRDSVLNPVGQVFEYIDPVSSGGEHRMEFRLYGNPNVAGINTPNVNDETNTISMGVSATRGDALTFFGYCPSTPIYLENGSTMRKSLTRGDQYGRDIITRDWLNLNGSITGLVHTYMDETIDGYKTFLKTVTIDSGNDNAKAGLNVQGDVNIDSGDNTKPSNLYVQGNSHIHGNEDIDGNLNVDGTSTLDGNVHMKHNLDVDGNLNVDGTSDQHGNVHMYSNLDVDGNANTDGNQTIGGTLTVTGKITGNGGAEISGGNGLKVNGNETVTGNLTVNGTTTTNDLTVTDDATIGDSLTVAGDILKKNGNTTQNYFEYATTNSTIKNTIVNNIIKDNGGLAVDSNNEIYVKLKSGGGIVNDSGSLKVDFTADPSDPNAQQIMEQTKAAILSGLNVKIPLTSDRTFYVNKDHANATITWKTNKGILDTSVGTSSKPFKTVQSAVDCITQSYDINTAVVNIIITKASSDYVERISLPVYSRTTGYIQLKSANETSSSNFAVISSTLGHGSTEDSTVVETSGTAGTIIVIGTGWYFKHLHLKRTSTLISDGQNHYDSVIIVENGGQAVIKNCLITQNYSGNASTVAYNGTMMRAIAVYNQSQLYFISESSIDTVINVSKGNAEGNEPIFIERSSQLFTFSHSNSNYSHNIYVNGTNASFVLTALYNSQISCISGQLYLYHIVGNITGSACRIESSSFISVLDDIGTEAGVCETNYSCWARPGSLLE